MKNCPGLPHSKDLADFKLDVLFLSMLASTFIHLCFMSRTYFEAWPRFSDILISMLELLKFLVLI